MILVCLVLCYLLRYVIGKKILPLSQPVSEGKTKVRHRRRLEYQYYFFFFALFQSLLHVRQKDQIPDSGCHTHVFVTGGDRHRKTSRSRGTLCPEESRYDKNT